MSISERIPNNSIALLPGMTATLRVENTFINPGPIMHKGVSRTLINGFMSENEEIGTLAKAQGVEGAVVEYTHKKSLSNNIWFYGRCGEVGLVTVVYVPIHDHASLLTGGPAFATYASESKEEGS